MRFLCLIVAEFFLKLISVQYGRQFETSDRQAHQQPSGEHQTRVHDSGVQHDGEIYFRRWVGHNNNIFVRAAGLASDRKTILENFYRYIYLEKFVCADGAFSTTATAAGEISVLNFETRFGRITNV